ncbi:MAG: alpha/beta hydrolase, partial [Clostridia bacterium]
HGSAAPATAVFDLQVPGRPEASTMDWFARLGYDTWCVDCECFGRSDKVRPIDASVSNGAEDLASASEQVMRVTGQRPLLYGVGAGALRAGLFAQRHPDRVRRLALDMVTGLLAQDNPEAIDPAVLQAFTTAALAADASAPSGAPADTSLGVLDAGRISAPTLLMRGEHGGVASEDELADFFARLPNADKQLASMPGVGHTSTLSKNWALVYHLLDGFLSQPPPAYTG